MDLFDLELTKEEREELANLRSQINVARAVLHHRLEHQLNQTELAKLAKTTQARVSDVEAMKGDPKLSTLARIALALGCMIDMVPIPLPEQVEAPASSPYSLAVRHDAVTQLTAGGTARWRPPSTLIVSPPTYGS